MKRLGAAVQCSPIRISVPRASVHASFTVQIRMLQPSETLATHRSSTHQELPPGSGDQPTPAPQAATRPSPPAKGWVTKKELLFVFLACSLAAGLLRTRDTVVVEQAWREKIDVSLYRSGRFPLEDEKLPPPIVTDLDSDGISDMVVLTYDSKVKVHSVPPDKKRVSGDKKPQQRIVEKFTADLSKLSEEGRPISMATGYLHPYQSMLQVRHQVIAVLTSDWTVLCFDHELKLLWKNKLKDEDTVTVSEGTLLVVPVSVQKGDGGAVIVGGREFSKHRPPQESLKRMRRGGLPDNEEELLSTLSPYSLFALEGRTGEERWRTTPKDSPIVPAYPSSSAFKHLKLILHKRFNREGEVSWHQYSSALRDSLPHSWRNSYDTHLTLGHFKKDRKDDKKPVADHISTVKDVAMDHIAGLAFGGQQPHSPEEHVHEPNVLILHSVKGINVFHLYFGRPLVSLPLSPYHSAHADINADGTIDHVHAVVNPGEAGLTEEGGPDCYGKATSMASGSSSRTLFHHSICKASHWTENFFPTDRYLPGLNQAGRKKVDHDLTEPLAPVLFESVYHSAPLKLHLGSSGWSLKNMVESYVGAPRPPPSLTSFTHSQRGRMYDSVFVLSSGRVTSVGPQGEFNWQMDTLSDWDKASEVIYNPDHPSWADDPNQVAFVHGAFTPSATPISLQAYGKKDHLLVIGWNMMEVLAAEDGHVLSTNMIICQPISPPVVVDFTGDGWNDIIITCSDGYLGYTLSRESGLWHSTIASMFVGMVIVIMAVYTRQRTIGLVPVIKAAQD